MAASRAETPPLRLDHVAGPALPAPVAIDIDHAIVGRALDSYIPLSHETVSRRHASFSRRAGQWFVADLGSRHGTLLNSIALPPHEPAALEPGDLLSLGPWTFRVELAGPSHKTAPSLVATTVVPDAGRRVERVPERELTWTAQQRLDLLIRASADVNASPSETELQRVALAAARAGSGYRRAAWLRPLSVGADASVELCASDLPQGESREQLVFSQSLLREASKGQLARLTDDSPMANYAHSIVSLGIHSALCAPVMVGGTVVGYIYLDARGQESPVHSLAAGFCQALSQICGLALANLRRQDLESRQRRIDMDLQAAREAQELILPPASGEFGPVRYAMRSKPGRAIAGDLFDAVPLDDDRVAFVIGDVAGKSISAGLLMATTQAYLHAALARYHDAARALDALNQYLLIRRTVDRFVTMWVGVIDTRSGAVVFVDAGHGHWLLVRKDARPEIIRTSAGIPIAVDPDYAYTGAQLTLQPGDRLVLYSDGIVEQRSPTGIEFGRAGIIDRLAASTDPRSDVDELFLAVERHANSSLWDDDATVASIEFAQPSTS